MIRRRTLFCEEKSVAPTLLTCPQITFSDAAILPLPHARFIGHGDTGIITQGLEEAFLSVARVIDAPVVIDHITVAVKRPSECFEPIVFDLMRVACPDGPVELTPDSIVTSIVVPGAQPISSETAYCRSQSFPTTVLNPGDLVAIRVEPTGTTRANFYATATIS